ncbi:hypothetical protein FNV43_RR03268 [Rhamnella rubrinervis]|uniref:(R)-mandelonitrile lyase n=1 Tax=Rhamnella rubrinervis TaxID=2594499 RepID=A0A8K0HJG3_9ROSA|nr:hypothetical protein FNV43_RR03268 [Rhamnella rubrinervis]
MKSVYNATDLQEQEEYDYIVKGGTAGFLNAAGMVANLMQEDDGNTTAQTVTSEDGAANASGRVLGGSSMINWVEATAVLHSNLATWQAIIKRSFVASWGWHRQRIYSEPHNRNQSWGRHGAVELLNKAAPQNLRVAVHATVERIIFSSNESTIGVAYTESKGKSHRALVREKGEVILSAGAIGSPQLLLLSGISPDFNLSSSLNIPVLHSQSNVGEFMADNINFLILFPRDLSYQKVVGITSDYYIEGLSYSFSFPFTPPFSFLPNPSFPMDLSLAILCGKIPESLSTRSLWLSSSSAPDVRASRVVRFNYFAIPVDLADCVAGMRKMGDMMKINAMNGFKYRDLEGDKVSSFWSCHSSMEEFCRKTVILFWHYHGRCPVGKVVLASSSSSDYDFNYMKSVRNASDLPEREEYDYIVVGGGTAGCPLAATLSQKYSVLVLERGNVPAAHPSVSHTSGLFADLIEEDDGTTPAQRFTSEDGIANARGRVLGGSSMINVGLYSRANSEFYLNSGIQWDMDMVDKAYQWLEDTIVFRSELKSWQAIFREALLEGGIGPDNGFSLDHRVGTKAAGSTFDGHGNRHGAVELLNKAHLKNLRVAVQATAQRIIFSANASSLRAIGVVYTDSKGRSHKAFVGENGEVILSAGAIGSPQLLLLSGIGPDSDLSSLNIPVLQSQSHVGKFMKDNPRNNINLVIPFPIDPSYQIAVGITSDYYIESFVYSLSLPITPPFSLLPNSTSSLDLNLAAIFAKFPIPLSKGFLRLSSSDDAGATPIVRFNYFADPADLASCVAGMRKISDILKTNAVDQFRYGVLEKGEKGFKFLEPSFPMNQSDDSSMEEFCRKTTTTFWHYHGGCVVGKVVDEDLMVIGTSSLRVVDGSTFTTSPGTNPQATVMMLGR